MKNKQWILKILTKIGYRNYNLTIPIIIDNESFNIIIGYDDEPIDNKWFVANDVWEISLNDLTNRELVQLYKNI